MVSGCLRGGIQVVPVGTYYMFLHSIPCDIVCLSSQAFEPHDIVIIVGYFHLAFPEFISSSLCCLGVLELVVKFH